MLSLVVSCGKWDVYLSCLLGLGGHQESFFHTVHLTSNGEICTCLYFVLGGFVLTCVAGWGLQLHFNMVCDPWPSFLAGCSPVDQSIWKPMCLTCCLPLFWIWTVQSLNCSTRKKGTRFFVHPESSLTIKLIFKAWLVCGVPGVSRNWARIVSCVSGGFDASNIQLKDTMVQDTAWTHLARCHSVPWALWEEEKLAGKVTSVTFWLVGTFEGGY